MAARLHSGKERVLLLHFINLLWETKLVLDASNNEQSMTFFFKKVVRVGGVTPILRGPGSVPARITQTQAEIQMD
jgi:hypothetical protein